MTLATAPDPTAAPGTHHWHDGLALAQYRRWPEAARAFGRATRAAPADALYWVNLAHAQRHAGALPRAVAAARRALQVDPRQPLALRLLGDCLLTLHRYADAASAFSALEAAGHNEPEAMLQHASVLQALQRHDEAIPLLLRLLALHPALVRAHALLSDSCRDRGLKREAVECMKTVLALEPGNLEALSRMSFEKRHILDWAGLDDDVQRIGQLIDATPPGSRRVTASFALLSLPLTAAQQLAAAQLETRALCGHVRPLPPVVAADRSATRGSARTRLGFVSFDFRQHPVAQLLVEVLEHIDRTQFELVLYSAGPDDGSDLRARLVATADGFVDLRGLSDPQAAARVRADGIDVLVDLMGHTRGLRLPIFAHRPAPVQVSFLGYPASAGADFIDYIIGDAIVTPLALAYQYSEKIAQLPLCFQPNGRGRPVPDAGMARAQAGLPEAAFVLCAFNHTYKITPAAFDAWCAVLHQVPHAVLWLKETNAQLHDNVRAAAAARGIAPDRVLFAPGLPYDQHFSRLALADVFVDTWPYNAHTTAADALWAGVPVVTVVQDSFASRVASSVLHAVGLGELACDGADAYGRTIVALAHDPARLAGLRRHLASRRLRLPLFDTPRYTRDLQALLLRMLRRWQAGQPPEHLAAVDGQPA